MINTCWSQYFLSLIFHHQPMLSLLFTFILRQVIEKDLFLNLVYRKSNGCTIWARETGIVLIHDDKETREHVCQRAAFTTFHCISTGAHIYCRWHHHYLLLRIRWIFCAKLKIVSNKQSANRSDRRQKRNSMPIFWHNLQKLTIYDRIRKSCLMRSR